MNILLQKNNFTVAQVGLTLYVYSYNQYVASADLLKNKFYIIKKYKNYSKTTTKHVNTARAMFCKDFDVLEVEA